MGASDDQGYPVRPAEAQPELPIDRVILTEEPDAEAVPMDVVFVGGGPAGLAGAIELARLAAEDEANGGGVGPVEIAVLEKSAELGEHCLSGAVVNPGPFLELFPDLTVDDLPFRGPVRSESVHLLRERGAIRLPTPPTMRNHGNHVASICEVVRWMGERAEGLGVNVFPGYPVGGLLVEDDGVRGVRTVPSGLQRDGTPGPGHEPAMDLTARVTVLAEGNRGPLTQSWTRWQGVESANPQIHALGVKELWQVPSPPDGIVHTLGWPLPPDTFGGSFVYPMGEDLLSLGLVVGLDYPHAALDVHGLLQSLKAHPMIRPMLEGGEMVEWGAKTIPEGGYYSVPERRHGDGAVVVGDAAGFVDVASLKGIHYAVQSGILAARSIFEALRRNDTSEEGLRGYTDAVDGSFIMSDLRRTRNVRLGFKDGFVKGSLKAGLSTLSGGRIPGGRIPVEEDGARARGPGGPSGPREPDGELTFSKVDAVFRSGNRTRDDIPSHLLVGDDVSPETAEFYAHLCPAAVYERQGDELVVNPPNCVDCRATDVLGPRWTPREGGSGPGYRRM